MTWTIRDPLYGDLSFSDDVAALARTAAAQRLRHVRLSNIDSLAMPGIAGITRFEHVVGATSLVRHLGFAHRLDQDSRRVLEASVLLHDAAITPFGHLVEEALAYVASGFEHEAKWGRLVRGDGPELGGADLQLYCGRRPGILEWARKYFGTSYESQLRSVVDTISGKGRFGPLVAGQLDLDNIDNVCRIAFHMGLPFDMQLPVKIAQSIVDCREDTGAIFADSSLRAAEEWLQLREQVYTHLMLAPDDFAGKVMLISASVHAFESGILREDAWALTDWEFLSVLVGSRDARVVDTVQRWLVGEQWELSQLVWFRSEPPAYDRVRSFSAALTKTLGREAFAYRIKDKRNRALQLPLQSGTTRAMGRCSTLWLLGVGSSARQAFSATDNRLIVSMAAEYFSASPEGAVDSQPTRSLFG